MQSGERGRRTPRRETGAPRPTQYCRCNLNGLADCSRRGNSTWNGCPVGFIRRPAMNCTDDGGATRLHLVISSHLTTATATTPDRAESNITTSLCFGGARTARTTARGHSHANLPRFLRVSFAARTKHCRYPSPRTGQAPSIDPKTLCKLQRRLCEHAGHL